MKPILTTIVVLICFLCLLLLSSRGLANDSTATIGTSGLVLEKNNNIEMLSEELYISRETIRVKYSFRNTTSKDIKTTVAFPLPMIDLQANYDETIRFTDKNYKPYKDPLHFRVKVDGRSQEIKSDAKVVENNRILNFTYYWSQIFPVNEVVLVEHAYTPAISSGFDKRDKGKVCGGTGLDAFIDRLDEQILAEDKKHSHGQYDGDILENYKRYNSYGIVEYVLTTGGN